MMQRYPIHLIFGGHGFIVSTGVFWLRAATTSVLPVFTEPLHYKMTEEGVEVSQKETQQFQKWEDMYRAVSTGKSLILYTDKIHASIFPRKDLGEKQSAVIAMISSHMEPGKVQIRS